MPKGKKEGSFGFTQLEEEEFTESAGPENVDITLQPDLPPVHLNSSVTAGSVEEETPSWLRTSENTFAQHGDGQNGRTGLASTERALSHSTDSSKVPPEMNSSGNVNGHHSTLPQASAGAEEGSNPAVLPSDSVQVQYDSSAGKVNVMQGVVVTRLDGSRYIDTQGIPERWSEQERPLRQRKMKLLKIFSIIATLFFFPSGMVAVYYAFRTRREFDEGIIRGNIDRAQKFARRSEMFIVLSFVMAVVVAALVVAIIERPYYTHAHAHKGAIAG